MPVRCSLPYSKATLRGAEARSRDAVPRATIFQQSDEQNKDDRGGGKGDLFLDVVGPGVVAVEIIGLCVDESEEALHILRGERAHET